MTSERDDLDPRLAEAIGGLRDTPPARDLWSGIAPRLAPRRPRGTVMMRWPVALAAGIALAVVSVTGTLIVLHNRAPVPAPIASALGSIPIANVAFTPADSSLALAIRDLESRIRNSIVQLDPVSRAGIERSLASLDHAIEDAALQRRVNPGDEGADRYFTATLRKKLNTLRTIVDLTTSRS